MRSESAVSVLSDKNLSGNVQHLIDLCVVSFFITKIMLMTEVGPPCSENIEQTITTPSLDDESEYVPIAEETMSVSAQETDEYKGRTLKLLSQLKLGTELTRVNLPVFCCEPRSLLQVIADAFRQPHLLLKLVL